MASRRLCLMVSVWAHALVKSGRMTHHCASTCAYAAQLLANVVRRASKPSVSVAASNSTFVTECLKSKHRACLAISVDRKPSKKEKTVLKALSRKYAAGLYRSVSLRGCRLTTSVCSRMQIPWREVCGSEPPAAPANARAPRR